MKRVIFFVILGLASLLQAYAQEEVKTLFSNMPDAYIPQLEKAWRMDLVDLFEAGKEAKLKNTMNGFSTLKKMTNDYLLLQISDRSVLEIKLLPLVNHTHILCMVHTVQGPVADSRISFYTTDWQPLDGGGILTPVSAGWYVKEGVDKSSPAVEYALSRLDMDLIHYSLSPDSLTLTATYMTPLYLNQEEQKKITPYLKNSPKVYTWNNVRFE